MENYQDKYIEIEFKGLNRQLVDLSKDELIEFCAQNLIHIEMLEDKLYSYKKSLKILDQELEDALRANETMGSVIKNINKSLEAL